MKTEDLTKFAFTNYISDYLRNQINEHMEQEKLKILREKYGIENDADNSLSFEMMMDKLKIFSDELYELNHNQPVDNKNKIKQLKQQVRYAKNPMEIKRLNQEIMKLQREVNKERKMK
jgi:hypothetical protein